MAYIVPTDISQLALAGSTVAELKTLAALKAELSDSYTVFHGVHWSRSYRGGTCYGEIDFVIVNRAGQVLLIEQKNGPLNESKQGLSKIYNDGQKYVGNQVRRSLENIRRKFLRQHGNERSLQLDYLIYCPDHKVRKLNAVGVDQDRIVDASKAAELGSTIVDILGDGAKEATDWAMLVEEFFRQSFELVPDIHAHLTAQKKAFIRLSGGLTDLVDNIEMQPLRLRIRGCAGCGKSVIARRLFDRALANGLRPLLVCYSRPLRERFKVMVGNGGLVQTWNGFCDEFLKSKGHRLDYDRMRSDPNFWEEVADIVIGETVPDGWLFDSLIVDEGQDFDQTWFDILGLFLKPNADIVWLEDQDQEIYNRHPGPLEGMVGYNCHTNFRSPETIARFIRRVLPFKFDNANDLPGLGVGQEGYDQIQDQLKIVGRIVGQLVKRGFDHSEIVVLTCRGHNNSIFSDRDKVGSIKLCRFTGNYDMFGNQVLTKGKLRFDSIYRFKGQQAPAVILIDVDPDPERLDQQTRLLYCGMTRATIRLELVFNRSNQFCKRFYS